jgi:transposase/IS5 family transposase
MAKPRCQLQMSLLNAATYDQAAGIDDDHWCWWFFREVRCAFDDADFADLYAEGGRSPISPGLLACITILQYCFRVSDRSAVENTIMRRDWRIALGLEVDWEGFDPTVLTRFRQRLGRAGIEERVFGRVLEVCGEHGLVSGRRVRVDATQMVSDLARLERADCLQEALRVVVQSAEDRYPELWQLAEFMELFESYGVECWVGSGSGGSDRLRKLGTDGVRLLALIGNRSVKGKATLEQLLSEHFTVDESGELLPLEADALAKDRIVTPHDPEARYGCKRGKSWLGGKVHVTETVSDDGPNVVTDVHTTDPRREDSTVLPELLERVEATTPQVDTVIADSGYASGENSAEAAESGVDLVTPPRSGNHRGMLGAEEFDIDLDAQVARCPEGHRSTTWQERKDRIFIRFPADRCRVCPRRSKCTTSKQGRSLNLSPRYRQLRQDRMRARTDAFKELYRRRSGIEATIGKLVHSHGLRRSRYRGAAREAMHALLAATALNVMRLIDWLRGRGQRSAIAAQAA